MREFCITMRNLQWGCTREKENFSRFLQTLVQPGPRQRPEPIGCPAANAENFRGLLMAQAGEVTKVHELGRRQRGATRST